MIARPRFELRVSDRRIRLGERTLIMGVVNVTPDSFSDGGRFLDPQRAIEHALELARQGADWIDVGGESTRPGSKPVPAEEELGRVLPVIRGLHKRLRSLPISIDTTKAEVAEQAVRAGAAIINDVSGLRFDPHLADVARRYRTPLILMHLRGRPATMQQKPFARSVWRSVEASLERSIRRALRAGVRRSQLILDPGLGFGKSRRQNYEILAGLARLQRFRLPLLVGTSRKSFLQAIVRGEGLEPGKGGRSAWPLNRDVGAGLALPKRAQQAAPLQIGDAAAVAASILAGAHVVRVHDVDAALPAVRIADAVLAAGRSKR
jgi:dihydropteroate synthase